MDHEIPRLILALVLTGLVLFAWNYYRAAFTEKNPESVTAAHREEKMSEKICQIIIIAVA